MTDIRVMVVADDLLVRTGLASLLGDQAGLRVVGQGHPLRYADESELFQPDVVVWDMGWQSRGLPDAIGSGWPILLLVGDTVGLHWPALDGRTPFGLLPRDSQPDQILLALQGLYSGLTVMSSVLLPFMNTANTASIEAAESLTVREQEVLTLLAQGLTNKAIALQLGITEHTVKFHVNAIMTKLNAQSRTDAVIRATRAGLVVL